MKSPLPDLPVVCSRALAVLLGAGACLGLPAAAHAATYLWKGGRPNNDWSTAANWHGGVAPANDGTADLVFGNSAAVFPSLSPAYSINSLTWNAGASAYTYDSGPLTLGVGGCTQNAVNAQGFNAPVNLSAAQTWTLASGAVSSYNLTLNGPISGAGGLLKAGTTLLTLGGTGNTFSDGLTVNGGTVNVPGDGGLGSTAGVVSLNAGQLIFTGSTTTARTFNLVTGTLVAASGTSLTYAGARVNGGSLGTGTQIFANGTMLTGTRISGTTLSQSGGGVTFNNVLLSGSTTFTQQQRDRRADVTTNQYPAR